MIPEHYWACVQGHKHLALKLANSDSVNYVDPGLGDTPLHQTCKRGWSDIIKILIEKYGCDLSVLSNYHRESPLDYAKRYNKSDVVCYLQRIGRQSLYLACAQGDKHLVLIDKLGLC